MSRRVWSGALVAVVLVTGLGWSLRSGSAPLEVQYQLAEERHLQATVLGSGTFDYRNTASLSPEVMGLVRRVLVEEGDRVEQGQLVLVLDQEAQKAEVEQRESLVRQQEVDIELQAELLAIREKQARRSAELVRQRLVDQAGDDQLQHEARMARLQLAASRERLRQSRAALAQARESLEKTHIRAPISGVVTSIAIKVGETAVPSSTGIAGSSLMTIADVATMAAEIKVDELDVARIRKGQSARVFAGAGGGRVFDGTVESISLAPSRLAAQGAAHERSYAVQVSLHGGTHEALRTGMSCRAEIHVDEGRRPLAIPVQALIGGSVDADRSAGEGEHHVFVEEDGRAMRRSVEPGVSDDAFVEIVSGLARGERIITGPARLMRQLRDQQSVLAVAADAGAGI